MIDGREYRTFFEKEVTLPYTMRVNDHNRAETFTFHFEMVYAF
jgi:hypothetical protein